jgi:hypothetical protein
MSSTINLWWCDSFCSCLMKKFIWYMFTFLLTKIMNRYTIQNIYWYYFKNMDCCIDNNYYIQKIIHPFMLCYFVYCCTCDYKLSRSSPCLVIILFIYKFQKHFYQYHLFVIIRKLGILWLENLVKKYPIWIGIKKITQSFWTSWFQHH